MNAAEIPKTLEKLFPATEISKLAEQTGFIKRERKIDANILLWTLVLGFGVGLQRTLAQLKRIYEDGKRTTICYSSWFERFDTKLVKFLKACVELALSQMADETNRTLGPKLDQFKDVVIQDSTVIRLHKALATRWPATRTKTVAAGVKVATLISVVANGPRTVAITGERTSEVKTVRIGPWIKDRIMLFDLGFFKFQLFARIIANGGFFVSRLKANANPVFVSSNKVHRGRAIDLVGKRWKEVEGSLKREVLDAEVTVPFKRRKYAGSITKDELPLRLVAIYNKDTRQYHVYVTNIPADVLSAEDLATLYRFRWEIEMLFKELKSKYALDVINTRKACIVEGLIWTAILTLIVSRNLFNLLQISVPQEQRSRYTPLRWANSFSETGFSLLCAYMKYLGLRQYSDYSFDDLAWLWEHQTLDPHVNRHRLSDVLNA